MASAMRYLPKERTGRADYFANVPCETIGHYFRKLFAKVHFFDSLSFKVARWLERAFNMSI